ncbi:MAG TPA: hypothetical protein VFA50_01765 [Stellaceae bacterium]|nr:hypothetical protein [Stellaceae bacterium]
MRVARVYYPRGSTHGRIIYAGSIGHRRFGAPCGLRSPVPTAPIRASEPVYSKLRLVLGTGDGRGVGTLTAFNTVNIYLRLFDSGGKLGICGYYVMPDSFADRDRSLFPSWINAAEIYSDETRLAPASFLYNRSPKANEFDAEASCIETQIPYRPELSPRRIRLRGHVVRDVI